MALALFRREPLTQPDAMPPPPVEAANPFTEAQDRWGQLREYAVRAMDVSRKVASENQQLLADNAALSRQIDHLLAENVRLLKDNRVIRAYATATRTRLTVIRESIEQAEREALHSAASHDREPERADTAEEDSQLREVVAGIERHTPTMPPTNEFPNGH